MNRDDDFQTPNMKTSKLQGFDDEDQIRNMNKAGIVNNEITSFGRSGPMPDN